MRKLDISYSTLARRCGCSRQAAHQWINGGNPRIDTLENAIVNGLGISMREFYSLDVNQSLSPNA